MRELLRRVAAKFTRPSPRIVATSYYPMLSEQSHFGLGNEFMLTLGVPIAPFATLFPSAGVPLWGKIIGHCTLFFERSSDALQRAIAEVGDARIRFAAPPFTPANAALAPDAWLFGIKWDLSPRCHKR